jgi:radical SAM superfamily enzyme
MYLAYFQSYSNTYSPMERLRELYEEALKYPGVTGIIIGTRPDCMRGKAKLSQKLVTEILCCRRIRIEVVMTPSSQDKPCSYFC